MLISGKRRSGKLTIVPPPTLSWRFDSDSIAVNPMPSREVSTFKLNWNNNTNIKATGLVAGKTGATNAIKIKNGEVGTFSGSVWQGNGILSAHFRFRPELATDMVLAQRRDGNNDGQMVMGIRKKNANQFAPFIWIGNTSTGVGLADGTLDPSKYHNYNEFIDVVFVRAGGNLYIYVNGVLEISTLTTNYGTNSGGWYFGRDVRDNNQIFNGTLEMMSFWDGVQLSQEQILACNDLM